MKNRVRQTTTKFPGTAFASGTHTGLIRQRNEDAAAVEVTSRGLTIVVCDGMGGHRGGDRASMIATDAFIETVQGSSDSEETGHILRNTIETANRTILSEAEDEPELLGMGTTLVGAIIREGEVHLVNIGDSRAYHFSREKELRQITKDHSLVQELVDQGELTPEEAAFHPRRNIITRVLGTQKNPLPETFTEKLDRDEMVLLASDGLHGYVEDEVIAAILASGEPPDSICTMLIQVALDAGGADNVTVAVIRAE